MAIDVKGWIRKIKRAAILILVLALVGIALWNIMTHRTVYFDCNGIDRDSNKARWLVRTDKETFEISNQWTMFRFRGREVAKKIKMGGSYKARVMNIGIFGMYRNIMEVELTDPLSTASPRVKAYIDSLKHVIELSDLKSKGASLEGLQAYVEKIDSLEQLLVLRNQEILSLREAAIDSTH